MERAGHTPTGRRRDAWAVVLLSFLWPGLGHLRLGRRRAALVYGGPMVVAVAVLAAQAFEGLDVLAARLIAPSFALTVLILVALLGLWRILAISDALSSARAPRRGQAGATALAIALAGVTALAHGGAGYIAWGFYDAGTRIFEGDVEEATSPPLASAAPVPSGPGSSEQARAPARAGRITFLLTGLDSGQPGTGELTDTLLVVSFEPSGDRIVMVSFPRDIAAFPLVTGGTYPGRINSLLGWARGHPEQSSGRPLRFLTRELGFLLGVPIQYYAAVDLDGFQQLVDLVGGVDLVNERAIDDPGYDWFDGTRGFHLPDGRVHLDGRMALAFVRSRTGRDEDLTRAARQQALLVALRRKLTDPALLPRLPALADTAGGMVKTNFPSDSLSELVKWGRRLDSTRIRRVILGPPYSTVGPSLEPGGAPALHLDMERLAALSITLFGDESSYAP